MAFGFPAFVKDRKALVLSTEETKILAIKVLEQLDWQEVSLHPFAIDYKTRPEIMTTGERVYINVTDSEIIIRSECLFPTRIFDFGKNKLNINLFWDKYEAMLT